MDFFHTAIHPSAIENVLAVLQSTMVSEGKKVKEFEDALSATLGIEHPVAVNSGTSALHLALVTAGIGPGDEVILPAQTFIATGLTILMCGARPVFGDIDYKTGNLDPASVRSKVTARTKAIMPVHWAGYPCDLDELHAIGSEHGLTIIEDAAHALGAQYKGRSIGTISPFTIFSFQAIKHLTTGDGGAVACRSQVDADHVQRLRWFGIDRVRDVPSILGERVYDLSEVGYKYHMNDLAAALGLGNLTDFLSRLARRRAIAGQYRSALGSVPGLRLLRSEADRESADWLFTVLVERRMDFIKALQERAIPTSVVHLRIDRNAVFGGVHRDLKNQERFDNEQISIPLHSALSDEDVEQVIAAMREGW